MLLQCEPVANVVDLVVPVEPLFMGQADEALSESHRTHGSERMID